MSKEQPLTVEEFSDGEENKFLISSPKEIQLTLHAIAQKKNAAAIYFDNGQRFFKTILLAANEEGVWFDVGPDNEDNNAVMSSEVVTFVTKHHGAKVQFVCHQFQVAIYASHPAFHCPLPKKMVRLQRRDYFRLPVPSDTPLTCIIADVPEASDKANIVTIMDISVGGIALTCREQSVILEAGKTYPACKIELPEVGTLIVSIQIKNLFDVTLTSGAVIKHACCEFIQLDGKMNQLLQRYIAVMQTQLSRLRE